MDNEQDLGAFAAAVPQKKDDLGAFASAVPAPTSPVARIAKDAGIAAARGIVGAPEALIGLADIPTGGAIGKLAEQAGIKTKETKNILADYYSPEYKAAQEKVNTAEGFVPTAVAALQNPSTIGNAAIESVPSMLIGGAIGRVARAGAGAAAISPVVAGGIGEGAVSAGQTAEQVRQESPTGLLTPEQAAIAAGSGALTGAINVVGGKIANKLGIADVDTMLAGGAGQAGTKGVLRRVGEGALSEGLLEEAPQSYQEQVAQNMATGQPLTQGAANAAAQGALAGGLMGGGANVPGPITGAAAKAAPETPGESVPIKTMEAAQARANRMTTETGTPFEVSPHPTVGGSFTVTPVEADNGKPGRGTGTESGDGRLPGAANAVLDAAVQPANVAANAGAGGTESGDSGRNQSVEPGRAAGTEVQPDRVSGNPADAGRANVAEDVALPPPGGPIEAAARLAPQAPSAQQEQAPAAPAAPQPVTLQDGTVVMPTNLGAGKVNPAEPASLRMQSGFDLAAQDSANSVLNDRKLSTEAQRAANNAKLGEADFQGLTIKVENPQGSVRQGVSEDKTPWATLMTEHYGYIKGTKGADAAGVDTFVGPNPQSDKAFVVDQTINGKFDEHKVMLGFNTLDEAKAAYADNYQPGWTGGENISETTVDSLKSWLKNGETNQPFSAAQMASKASQEAQPVAPTSPSVAQAQAANVVPPELAVPKMIKFPSVEAATNYAAANNINAVAVKNASGKVILAPLPSLDPTFSRKQDADNVAELNTFLKAEGTQVKPVATVSADQRIIQAVAEKAFGTKMTFVSDNPVFEGVAIGGKLFVTASEKHALIPVAFHEVSHFLQTTDKKIAGDLQTFMADYIKSGVVADRQAMENNQAPADRQIDRQGAINEVLADIGGSVATDPKFWQKMAEHDESLFRKIAYKMMQLMTKAIQVARGSHFDIDRMVTDRAAVQDAIAKAWGQFNKNRDNGIYKEKAEKLQTTKNRIASMSRDKTKTEAFKKWFDGSKVVDKDGNPLVVYHGGSADMSSSFSFDSNKMGSNGSAEGYGFYFTTDKATANGYKPANSGSVAEVYLSMKKPMPVGQKSFSNQDLKKIIRSIVELETKKYSDEIPNYKDGFMSNYVDTYSNSLEKSINEVAKTISNNELAADQIAELANSLGSKDIVFKAVNSVTGFDGIVADGYGGRGEAGGTIYVAWFPEQIKSASGNAGTFDAKNSDIFFSRTPPEWINQVPGMTPEIAKKVGLWVPEKTIKERFNELKQDLGKKMVQGIVDQFAPIKALDEKAYMQARLSKASDGGLEAMLMYGKLGLDKDGAITVDNKGGFIDSMKKLGGEQERFFSWVAGNRAAELKAEGKENLFTDTDISALKNLNQGTTAEGKDRTTLYKDVLKDLNGFSKSILDIAEKSGLIDGNERHKWEKDFYVPFYRVLEDDGKTVGPRNLAGLTNQYAFKKLKGGKDNLNDLMQNTVMNWAHLLSASLKNQAAATTLDAAQKLGVAHNVTSSTKGSVFVLKGGKEMHYVVDDPFIADAVSSLAFTGMKGTIIDIATKAKRMLSFGVTFGPTYKIRNIIRDQLQAVGANPMSLNVAKNLVDGIKYSSKSNPMYAQMLAGGGLFRMGSAYEDNRAQHLKNLIGDLPQGSVLNTPHKVKEMLNKAYDGWMELGDRGETITRAAIYSQMIANGASHLEASYNTRDSMDFGLQGSWPAVRLLTQTVPFMNARLQGLYKLGRAAKDDPRRFATVLGATTIATIALMLASRDDDDWKRREEWDRDNFWWFKMGGHALRIPKPFEMGAMASIAERGLDMIMDGMDAKARDRFASRLYRIVMDNLSMNPVPQLVKPAIDIYANNDPFRNRAIESNGMEKLSKAERIGGNTTAMAIMLGKAGVLSPVQIDYIIAGYFGWLGSHIAMAADTPLRPAMNLPTQAAKKVDDAFFVGDWVKELPANQSRYVEEFYKQAVDVREAMADMQHYKKLGQIDKVKDIMSDKKDLLMQGKKFALATTNINRLNLRIQQVQASSKMDATQKRTEVDRLSGMRNKIAERVMK